MKKIWSILLTLSMALSLIPAAGMTVLAADDGDEAAEEEMLTTIAPAPEGSDEEEKVPDGPFKATFKGFDEDLVIETEGAVTKPEQEPTMAECYFAGWTKSEDYVYVCNFASEVICQDTTYYPVWVKADAPLKDYTVTVLDSAGKPAANAWVVLHGVGGTLGNTTTDANGAATFENLPEGFYNIQIMTEDRIFVGSYDTAADGDRVYTMSKECVTVLTIAFGDYVADAVYDGVEELMEDEKDASAAVFLSFALMQRWPTADDATDAQKAIIQAAGARKLFHFDVQVEKTVGESEESTVIDRTKHLLTFMIPFDTSREDLTVYRYCGGEAEIMTPDAEKPENPQDGHCFIDTENGMICIYTTQLTSFAIGYAGGEEEEEPEISGDSYGIGATWGEHGTVDFDGETFAGQTITVTTTPDKGWTLETITVTDSNDNEIELEAVKYGEIYTFVMPADSVMISAAFMEDNSMLNFCIDVQAEDYYYDAVLWACEKEITTGVDNLHFGPDEETTRAQMVTFLWRAAGCPQIDYAMDFEDVSADAYYAEAVRWAVGEGITKGVAEKQFAPDQTVTRAEVVTFLSRLANIPPLANMTANGPAPSPYTDVATDAYYYNAVLWAVGQTITTGTDEKTFSPNEYCTRAQVVTFLHRYFTA